MSDEDTPDLSVIRDHRRQWRDCLYVYPVVARRSKGVSIGVNLNPERDCTFSCVYCQVDRRVPRGLREVSLTILRDELRTAMEAVIQGQIWNEERFAGTPGNLRRLNDIAFSGDGEPTCLPNFDAAVQVAAEVKRTFNRERTRLVIITNSTHLDSPQVRRALPILDAHHGEIWAKLDAGTEETFQRVNRPHGRTTLEEIVRKITSVAVGRPIVIQTLFLRTCGAPPPAAEVEAYVGRLRDILGAGGKLKLVQIHTVARAPAESFVSPLADGELDALAEQVREAALGVPVETYYGLPPELPKE
jgi:wyosine [tRNA(Phe)-imidazoG37] synthetase (radical SAM superfamily)